jgi:hypothetical protein
VRDILDDEDRAAKLGRAGRQTVETSGDIALFAERVAAQCECAIAAVRTHR